MIFSYYGSKSKLWKEYPLPRYNTIIEPFAGAANYALRHGMGKRVIVVEKDPIVVAMLRWLRTVDLDFIRALPILNPHDRLPKIKPVEAYYFLGFMAFPGSERTKPRKYVGKFSSVNWNWNYIAAEIKRIRHWEVIEGDYMLAPDIKATWFIDPPYSGQKVYPVGRDLDYKKLAQWCRSRKGQVIVCENDTAKWLPFHRLCEHSGQSNTSKLRNEGVWIKDEQDQLQYWKRRPVWKNLIEV